MYNFLLSPPVAFLLVLGVLLFAFWAASSLSYRRRGPTGALTRSYTGGEQMDRNRIQPDYGQFFPFAFFFTLLHVATLLVATVPLENAGSLTIAAIYILGALLGLFILFRR